MHPNEYFEKLKLAADHAPLKSIESAIKLINETLTNNKSIFVCGNGGSALTASHYVTDWGKMRWVNTSSQFKVICLSDNVGMLTAYANDISYDEVFSNALRNYGSIGDTLIVVSGSGNSNNIMRPIIELPSLFIKYDFILSPDIRVKIEWLKKKHSSI